MSKNNNLHASSDVASLHKVRARQCPHQAALSEKSATGDTDKSSRRGKKSLRPNALNLIQFNISGLRHKKTELLKVLKDKEIHIALLQETLHSDADLTLTGYTHYACTCTGCQGVVTYLRNDVQGDVTHLPLGQSTCVQRATIWHTGRKFTIYNVYSPPKTTCDFSFLQAAQYEKTICAGDFNGHSPEWGYPDHNNTGTRIEELCESSNLSVLQNANSPPTLLHRAHLTLSRPDLTICSSDIENSCRIEVIDGMGSDHRPIITTISTPPALTHSQRTRWNFRKANWAEYRKTTEELLSCLEETEDTDLFNEQVTTSILKAASQHIPQGSRKNFKPFWNGEIQAAVTEREKARQLLEKSPSPTTRTLYNKTCAKVKLTVKQSKKNKWIETCKDLDLRQSGTKVWSLVSNLSGERRKTNPKPIHLSGESISEDQKKAEHFNRYFASVNRADRLTEEDRSLLAELRQKEKSPRVNNSLFEEDFTMMELGQALGKLKLKKAPGLDKVHNEMLRELGPIGKEVLLRLINKTWKTSKVPKAWKTALITPLLKNGKPPGEAKSYRPISLTSCIGKLAERMVNSRLYWYLESTNSLNPHQAGFRKGSCTEDQLFKLTQNIQDGFQEAKHTVAVFVDLQQAYDRVWRKGLLMKMMDLGIHGKLYKWIKFFLTDRNIKTKVNNAHSSKEVLEEGLPQGSCLSCTLFLIFFNDVTNTLKSEKTLYADDLALWQTHSSTAVGAGKLNEDLKRLHDYCQKWKLKINCSKTVYTIFSKSHIAARNNLQLKIGSEKLGKEEHPTYLGIKLDQKLTLKAHVENTKIKAKRRLQLLKKLAGSSWGSDKQTLRGLYLGYVRSALEYSNSLLTMCSASNRETLDRIQNNALRFINGGMRSTPTAACEILANVEPLGIRRDKSALELFERTKRKNPQHPNRKLVDTWKPKKRLKQKSILHHVTELTDSHHLPQNRQETKTVNQNIPPHATLEQPRIETALRDNSTKSADPVTLMLASHKTIDSYSSDWIHVYTDGSAFKGTTKAGYGIFIQYPDGSSNELFEACGEKCTNYEAEMMAIETAIYHLSTIFQACPSKARNIVIFSDSQSVLQALESDPHSQDLTQIVLGTHHLKTSFGISLVMQWIPGHSQTPGNDRADTLAKRGSRQEQPNIPISFHTAKQIIKTNSKQDWMDRWAQGKTGRAVFKHMTTTKTNDCIDQLERKEQATIFRLRTQHIQLNLHLNRIKPEHPPMCPLCDYPYETVDHHLFHCAPLSDLRATLLPPRPTRDNTLYGKPQQLKRTCTFHNMALDRRARAQRLLDQ